MISILLATYNGAAWLPALLESVQSQTIGGWKLLARDDGSTDETRDLLNLAAKRDRRMVVVEDSLGRLGVKGNFEQLLLRASSRGAPYLALADQDDVWLPEKLQRQRAAMQELEAAHGQRTPLLVHTDLRVVDEQLRTLHPSHTAHERIARDCPGEDALRVALAHNFVTGCASLCNRALVELALPMPAEAVLHDWWLALCAAAAGHVAYVPKATVLYRQHRQNVVGASGIARLVKLSRWRRARENLRQSSAQARALARRLRDIQNPQLAAAANLADRYGALFGKATTVPRRLAEAWRLSAGRPGLAWRLLFAAAAVLPGKDASHRRAA
ncbi:MAG: glycosyltransferase [Planctomycetia bacterium]|nr:glycosyltransferase [Planctomycetia bacterium]